MPAGSSGQEHQISVAPDTGESIIRNVLSRSRENEILKKEYLAYKRVFSIDNLDDNEQITDREREEVVSISFGGKEELLEVNGKPVRKIRSTSPRFDLMNVLDALLKLDEFKIIRIDKIEDKHFYVISFKPKPGARPNGDVEDVIVRSEGEVYIDIEKFYIKKISAKLIKKYERAWGIFNLSQANLEMEIGEFEGIMVMKYIIVIDKYWLFFRGDTFEKQMYIYKDYQKKF